MRWITEGCECGTNTYKHIEDGVVTFKEKNTFYKYIIKDGTIKEVIRKEENIKTHLKYYNFFKEWRNGKLVKFDNYKYKKQSLHGKCYDITLKLQDYDGYLIQKYYRGSKISETFVYKNNKVAYTIKDKAKEFKVFYPNGKIWIEILGKDNKPTFRVKGWRTNYIDFVNNSLKENYGGVNRNLVDNNRSYSLTIYNKEGKLNTSGQIENGQLVGEWIKNGEKKYLLEGVLVSEAIFKTPPEQLDPNEILQLENSQLRASLLSKIGFERVLQKCKATIVHEDKEMVLFSIPMIKGKIKTWRTEEGDDILMLLKVRCPSTGVYYVLRVPPDMTKCEQARQWTFGLNTRPQVNEQTKEVTYQVEPKDYYEFVEET